MSDRIAQACAVARSTLLSHRNEHGWWLGELASSALSTATAVSALSLVIRSRGSDARLQALVNAGVAKLAGSQNADGGWGDTDKSFSNISTAMLVRAAFHLSGVAASHAGVLQRLDEYIERIGGVAAVRRRYGKDQTFSVPILTNAALAGQVDWSQVDPLPFELACLPHSFYAALQLPVVSYALPALIAVGQVRHAQRPSMNPVIRAIRNLAVRRSLAKLEAIQPTSGGFLEATPLTSFVLMSLVGAGRPDHPVAHSAIEFLVESARPDGSWPIDSNLSVWLTTLSVNALSTGEPLPHADRTRDWILAQQCRTIHPYTNAAPGGWGWSHLSGSVPDADDTPGALLALANLPMTERSRSAATAGVGWLLDLQNDDGGWPTFCRGWTNLPFDRSGDDLTAHAIRSLLRWADDVRLLRGGPSNLPRRIRAAVARGRTHLQRTQRGDGSWLPLWFGNQHADDDINPVYGTARVLAAWRGLEHAGASRRGRAFLRNVQGSDGGWGGDRGIAPSVEETALACEALCDSPEAADRAAAARGLDWLASRVLDGSFVEPSPIGFYFAKLWYYEKLYPIIFAAAALGRASRR